MRAMLFAAVAAALSMVACGGGYDINGKMGGSLREYRGWKKGSPAPITGPLPGHGAGARLIYGNGIAFSPLVVKGKGGDGSFEMRDGSVVIKESYGGIDRIGVEAPMLTIMLKLKEHPLAQEGWLYFVKRPGSDPVLITGRLCIGCHESANEGRDGRGSRIFRDYLFEPFIP
jgi:hypothetical protein